MQLKEDYFEDIRYFDEPYKRWATLAFVLLLYILPLFLGRYWTYVLSMVCVYSVMAVGLNLLMGYCGQLSLGHAAFLAIGAYTSTILNNSYKVPFIFCLLAAGLVTALVGLFVGLAALRLKGLYLGIITMGFAFIVEEVCYNWEQVTKGVAGILVPEADIFGFVCNNDKRLFYLIFTVALVMFVMAKNIVRTRVGRAFAAIRDSDIATESMGINLFKNKLIAFGISAFYAGVAGSLFSLMATFISPENFTLMDSISFVVMILVGGLGSISGSIMGAAFITLLSEVIRSTKDYLPVFLTAAKGLQALIYGGCIVLFIMYEPAGLHGRWLKIRLYFETFPLGKRPKSKRMMVTGARDLSM